MPLGAIFTDDSPIVVNQTSQPQQKAVPTPQAAPAVKKETAKPSQKSPSRPLPPLGLSVKPGANKAAAQKQNSTPIVADKKEEYNDAIVTQESMLKVWETFANQQEAFIKQTLNNADPTLKNGQEICITLENTFKEDKVNEIKTVLMPFLRRQLRNNQLTLSISITDDLVTTRAFTPKEKLELMMKENPALGKLIDTLGLEME